MSSSQDDTSRKVRDILRGVSDQPPVSNGQLTDEQYDSVLRAVQSAVQLLSTCARYKISRTRATSLLSSLKELEREG